MSDLSHVAMTQKELQTKKLPDAPGVYQFLGPKKEILYIGKATSLRDRTRSYFSDDLINTRGPRLVDMITKSVDVYWIETDSVLEALILEANLIKKHLPPYNTREKDGKSFNHVVITEEEYPRIFLERERSLSHREKLGYKVKKAFGPYPSGGSLAAAMKIIRRIFPYRNKQSKDSVHDRFYKQLHLAPETGSEEAKKAYQKVVRNISLLFQGKKSQIIKSLEREMKSVAKKLEFERAGRIKSKIFALQHIQDVSLLTRENIHAGSGFRIEAYDIAHMGGQNMVGVMVVLDGGVPDKSSYRKFIIRSVDRANDTAALTEVLVRRFRHDDWPAPDLVVVDGGEAQLRVGQEVVRTMGIEVPVVSVVKDERHKPKAIKGRKVLTEKHKDAILLANNESHRFALSFHVQKRRLKK
ncbi:MAG: excinuclease ABC subunit C [Planctomycetota bacterium]|jgi:excinuclease ABC subunit C